MIYIKDHWESVSTLDECINLVKEYNEELAAKIAEFFRCKQYECNELRDELEMAEEGLRDAENEIDSLIIELEDKECV